MPTWLKVVLAVLALWLVVQITKGNGATAGQHVHGWWNSTWAFIVNL